MLRSCVHCDKTGKYKCPTCTEPYCSVGCYKKHKEEPCTPLAIEEPEEIPPKTVYDFPTEDTVSPEKLNMLEHSKELRNYLVNPHLRRILEELNQSLYPDSLMEKYMQEPLFIEFVDECLKIVQPNENCK